jgi:hypothetical protein
LRAKEIRDEVRRREARKEREGDGYGRRGRGRKVKRGLIV